MNTDRHRWSWRSCFAVVKHNKKTKKQINHQSILQRINSNGNTHNKHIEKINENSNIVNKSIEAENPIDNKDESCLISEAPMSNEYDKYIIDSSCIIKIDPLFNDNENNLIDGDTIQKINNDHFNSTINNLNVSSTIKSTQLDSIIEHYYEDNYDHFDQPTNLVRLCCDREIVDDSNNLYSRLFDLSQMKHVITQFNENGNLLNEFTCQIDKLKIKANNIFRTSAVMPRDAELLEARYSTLLSTIEILSLLLKIGQIPACRSLINRLIFSIEQRMEQLNKLVQLTLISTENNQQRRDINDEDFLSFRSALSSYEHLFTTS
ncbi:unnamed protein product [Rotaria sordida]|uniref:Uncharacterized protein n=1 Tax=Rotaria sordida TaxID=392033 RepID=A0A813ZRL2_9BILA|nr:unnamed protein product [Rotaria sordida]CAF0939990.1 unnamed protein product [Rotaria sordida]CAF0940659.1 unnamed protein product [Rotaria sordida]